MKRISLFDRIVRNWRTTLTGVGLILTAVAPALSIPAGIVIAVDGVIGAVLVMSQDAPPAKKKDGE
jgi:hypothetical protein